MSGEAFRFPDTFVHLADGGAATPLPVGPGFWSDLAGGRFAELGLGWLVSRLEFGGAWQSWERHPRGDELVCLLSGELEFEFEREDGPRRVSLDRPGAFLVVPRGVWHTARAKSPASALFVTAGEGTEHRPA